MPIGDQQTRSRRYSASVAQVSSIDDPTNSTTSSAPGAPISIRIRRRPRSLHTRIVTTHVEGSATSQDTARSRSPKRLSGVRPRVPDDAVATGSSLRLINGFDVTVDGRAVPLATNAQRLLAFLALRERPQPRSAVAGTLWIDRTDRRAAANLRTALWKLGTHGHRLIAMRGNLLALADDVVVDFRVVIGQARALLQRTGRPPPGGEPALSVDVFAGDLLPDWDEDWILFERERLRQLRMHAIEALAAFSSAPAATPKRSTPGLPRWPPTSCARAPTACSSRPTSVRATSPMRGASSTTSKRCCGTALGCGRPESSPGSSAPDPSD